MDLSRLPTGTVIRVNGPIVEIEGLNGIAVFDLVEVGPQMLPGEAVAIRDGTATLQVYDYTGGLRPGDPARTTGRPLSVALGPGLLGGVFDGTMRPLTGAGPYVLPGHRGLRGAGDRLWSFQPAVHTGDRVEAGMVLGQVPETSAIEHRILVPPGVHGTVESIAAAGTLEGEADVAIVEGHRIGLRQAWPVRRPRPAAGRLEGGPPLHTGQRVLDLLFPLAKGGNAAVPGGFGTGKTVLLQQIAKWCDADVIVYVGCGERGNEMADVLEDLPTLTDPRTGRSLMERTVIIANTSNMPVMAREASIYTGVTVGEYFRDMGYDAVVIADSTSRWAEALREFASRTNELPAEEGYPAGLASALAAFYERAGRFTTLGGREASVTIIGAVSPPGGDMTEPVTTHTNRFVRCLWSLDRDLAYARHYPAVSWSASFSRDAEVVATWYARQHDRDWDARRRRAIALLGEADRLQSVADLIGAAALPDRERIVLLTARVIREAVLQQSALSHNDAFCAPVKQAALLEAVLAVHDRALALLPQGIAASAIEETDLSDLIRARERGGPTDAASIAPARAAILDRLEALR
ncbi:MAG TPA: V-type ATP synthase subunit A [Candidatus Limnocylindrales bacterium]|nr:V-type ATP synthase subunit A [Candidatus Limnocylindrales bacterium]